ncbi:MAG: methyltransferase family protein [Stellaceae bacterium]
MSDANDNANVIIHPPIAWLLAFLAGLGLDWIRPLPFVPATIPRAWLGGLVIALGVALGLWAIFTFRRAGTGPQTHKPTKAIVAGGPFRVTRNPIYTGMFIGQIGLAIAVDSLWVIAMLVPFFLLIRYGVVAREEAYLERKFGRVYLDYKARTRRWI